ncbi:MAG: NADP-dependent oxidoreductase [Betaproteobacteria bacterium]
MNKQLNLAARQVRLHAYPVKTVNSDTWKMTRDEPKDPLVGQLLVRNRWLSVDPGMRGWITPKRSYMPPVQPGEVMRAFGVAEVVHSNAEGFKSGDVVTGFTGVQTLGLIDAQMVRKIDLRYASEQQYLSGLGMTGYTAYFGLLDVGKPRAGQTVVVSAAAGAVGSIVCQIAKIKGCRVVGIAGGKEKTQYLKETLGLDAVVDYKAGAIGNTLKAAAPEGIDIYFDNVGGDILEAVLMQINRHARIVVCGGISQYLDSEQVRGPANYLQLIAQSATMQGFTMRDYMSRASEAFMALAGWHAKGEIRFRDHVLLGIESFPQAFGMLFTGANQGKLLIQLESENS